VQINWLISFNQNVVSVLSGVKNWYGKFIPEFKFFEKLKIKHKKLVSLLSTQLNFGIDI